MTSRELSYNGVRMVRDHEGYAEMCKAVDIIIAKGEFICSTCTDLYPAVLEAEWFAKWVEEAREMRKEIDRWRSNGDMGNPEHG